MISSFAKYICGNAVSTGFLSKFNYLLFRDFIRQLAYKCAYSK